MVNRFKKWIPSGTALLLICLSPLTSQAAWLMTGAGDKIQLTDRPGSPGGEFGVKTNSATSGVGGGGAAVLPGEKFVTFCMQKKENISFNTTYKVQSLSFTTKSTAPVNLLKAATSALYRSFTDNAPNTTVLGESYNGTATDANLLQNAFWSIQLEQGQPAPLANRFYDAAIAAFALPKLAVHFNSTERANWGGVRIMNLVSDDNIESPKQDQLARVLEPSGGPNVPEPSTMLLFGLGAIGLVLRSRQRKVKL